MDRFLVPRESRGAADALELIENRTSSSTTEKSSNSTGGYILDGRHYCGATAPLRAAFYQNYKAPQRRTVGASSKLSKSSKARGSHLHRHVHHRYICKENPKTCVCASRFGGSKSSRARVDSSTRKMLKGVDLFLKRNGWSVVSCEVPCAWPRAKCATAVDMICCNSDRTLMLLVELKTGYGCELFKVRTDFNSRTTGILCDGGATTSASSSSSSRMMQGEVVREFLECTPHNQHQLQMWFTAKAVCETYGYEPDRCVALYLQNDGNYWAYYAEPWWITKGKLLEEALVRSRKKRKRTNLLPDL